MDEAGAPPRMTTILYLSPGSFDKGGVSRYTRYQLRALRELVGEGSVRALSLLPPDARSFEEPFAIDFASLGPSRAGKALFTAAAAIVAASARPRVVWSAHLGLGPLGLALGRALGAATVLDVYGSEVWTDVGPLRRAALRRTDWVVSDCHNTRAYAIDHGLRGPDRFPVHWDCIDLARFSPGDPGDVLARHGVPGAEGAITVLTVGRMSEHTEYKGYDRLIEVMARLPRDVPARLVLAGDGARRPALEALARARGVADRAHFTGPVHERDLCAIYRACDVFALVTNVGPGGGEGIPLTPLEAAACGKPILVGDQDGSREAAEDGVSGFVLDPFDLDALAERVTRLAKDPALRARMGAAGRARIEREHGFERFRDRTAELLREIGLLPA
jgi:phosphatidylinositol alpha-1,6-mannosyltransferase